MEYRTIRFEREGPLARVTMARPERRNALSLDCMSELLDCFHEIGACDRLRAVILAAEGKAFCAGHDLSEMTSRSVSEYRTIFDVCSDLMMKIQSIRQPVIAEIQGVATAAGCQLAASCDLAIASDDAWFATPGVRIGLFCTTPMVALTRAIGRKRAMEMLLTGMRVDAALAAEWGLINRVVPAAQLSGEVLALARQIIDASGFTIGLGKQAFYSQIELDQPKAYAYAKEVMTMNALDGDAQEGIAAFLEKRAPSWR